MTHLAAAAPSARVLRLLLKGQVYLNVLDANGKHPIHWAARYQRLDNVRLLVEEAGIDPDLTTKRLGLSPLVEAAGSAKSGRTNPEAVAVIQYLLGTGRVDVNAKDSKVRATALHFAAMDGALDVLEVLVAAGADLSAKRMDGKTAAQVAKASGHTEAARYLVEQSILQKGRGGHSQADADAAADPGPISASSPGASGSLVNLLAAAKDGDLEQVRLLVEEQGVEPRQSAAVSASLLNMAAMGGQMPVVRYLVEEAGVDPSVPDQLVCSALSNLWLAPGEIPT